MSKKAKKFTPKSGNPAKRAVEIENHNNRDLSAKRAKQAMLDREKKINDQPGPTTAGNVHTPPADLEPVKGFVPTPTIVSADKSKKGILKKVAVTTISMGALGALIFSSFVAPYIGSGSNETAKTMSDQGQQQPEENSALVDADGNPIDGSPKEPGKVFDDVDGSESITEPDGPPGVEIPIDSEMNIDELEGKPAEEPAEENSQEDKGNSDKSKLKDAINQKTQEGS